MKKKALVLIMDTIMLLAITLQTALAAFTYDIADGTTVNLTTRFGYLNGSTFPYDLDYSEGDILNVEAKQDYLIDNVYPYFLKERLPVGIYACRNKNMSITRRGGI